MMKTTLLLVAVLLLKCIESTVKWELSSDQRHVTDITELDIPSDITSLTMSRSSITSLPAGSLNFSHCTYIALMSGVIEEIDRDAFQGLAKLDTLYLSGNKVRTILPGTFRSTTELTQLIIVNNLMTTLVHGVFNELVLLEELYLSGNEITSIDSNTFTGLENLGSLFLGRNKLTSLPVDVFYDLPKLWHLDLESNQLLTIPENIFKPERSSVKFEIRENNLTVLPNNLHFPDSTKMRSLILFIDSYLLNSDSFQGMPKLTSLWLKSDFNGNNILSDVLSPLANLTTISFFDSDLLSIPSTTFRGLSRLTNVRIRNNVLKSLPSDLFEGLLEIDTIQLSYNHLEFLPLTLFNGLTKVKKIYLGSNKLQSIPEKLFQGLPNLEYVSLSSNKLTAIPDLGLPKSGVKLFLSNNEVNCDYKMCWIVNQDFNSLSGKCHSPSSLKDTDISTLQLSDFPNCDGKLWLYC